MASIDVSIRGAGIFGLSVAWACVQAGARVELVDPNGLGAGASGGIVGALAPHVPENWNPKKQFQLDSLLMAETFWSEVATVSGSEPGYVRAGRIQPVTECGLELAETRARNADMLWKGQATWTLTQDGAGWRVASPSGWFIRDTLSAHIHPRQACAALAGALLESGVPILEAPKSEAKAVVWATGVAGLEQLSGLSPRLIGQGIKGQAALFELDRASMPQVFVETLHIIPHFDGTVAVGSTTEREFNTACGTDAQLDDIIERVRDLIPELAQARVIERWAGLRPRTRSRAPMLGRWPDRSGHYIANGGFKIGFGMAPKVGHVMAQLVLEGRNEIPEGFDVTASL